MSTKSVSAEVKNGTRVQSITDRLSDKKIAVDGYNLVPNIRPLETLHNSLSLNQITEFFDKIIKVIIDRDPRTKTGRFRTERVGPGFQGHDLVSLINEKNCEIF